MYIKKKIPIENKSQFFERSLEMLNLMRYEFPSLKLDLLDVTTRDWWDIVISYHAHLSGGRCEELPAMSMGQLLNYVEFHKPQKILRKKYTGDDPGTVIWPPATQIYETREGYRFTGEDAIVDIHLSTKKLKRIRPKPHHFVDLRIDYNRSEEKRVESIINKL